MNLTYKNSRQEEFSALVAKLEDLGIKPAGVARMLSKTRAAVSTYLSGKRSPSESLLALLRIKVDELTQGKEGNRRPSMEETHDQLREMAKRSPEVFNEAQNVISALHRSIGHTVKKSKPKPKPANSKAGSPSMIQIGPKGETSFANPRRAKKSATPSPPAPSEPPTP